jgi:hypothetical protein
VTSEAYAPPVMKVTYGGPDRAVIMQAARMKPYKCVICNGESDGRPFVDFGLDLEWYGSVYFCGYCFINVANKLGYQSPDQVDNITDKYTRMLKANHRLAYDNGKYRDLLGSLLDLSIDERDTFVARFREFQAAQKAAGLTESVVETKGQSDSGANKQITI